MQELQGGDQFFRAGSAYDEVGSACLEAAYAFIDGRDAGQDGVVLRGHGGPQGRVGHEMKMSGSAGKRSASIRVSGPWNRHGNLGAWPPRTATLL
jgi:hypothetical protein